MENTKNNLRGRSDDVHCRIAQLESLLRITQFAMDYAEVSKEDIGFQLGAVEEIAKLLKYEFEELTDEIKKL